MYKDPQCLSESPRHLHCNHYPALMVLVVQKRMCAFKKKKLTDKLILMGKGMERERVEREELMLRY